MEKNKRERECSGPGSRGVLVGPLQLFEVVGYPSPVPLDGSDRCAKWSTPSGAAASA